MNSPRSPTSQSRLRLIEQAMAEADKVTAKQQTLLKNEKARQEAEENLSSLTRKVNGDVEEVSDMLQRMNVSAAELRKILLTRAKTPTHASPINSPPATPSRQRAIVTSPPATPTYHAAVVSPLLSCPPRGTTLTQTECSDPVYPGSKYPAYVVYHGKAGIHGVFYAWSTQKELFYNEFCTSKIPVLLAKQESSEDECFIVVEGVKPMACDSRDIGGAWVKFNEFKANGLVRQIHEFCTSF
ncbi:hypothetical protein BT96DRAFT_946745 [Gymnopus androsaceus JB14]|uniref:Uncharacterized protein n=1 Tax=Gymnopus androsaceus JB14 TaxID=1447944 RepID=A0A6A4GUR9_9AGAR|nr:hypothetical protein BT96DRAFT_946745 [Gymnopus androsaceus JB14]